MNSKSSQPIFINENKVKIFLTWKIVIDAVEEALKASATKTIKNDINNTDSLPFSNQPARSFTFTKNQEGVLLSMPGYVGNYKVNGKSYDTLACKLVTSFKNNEKRSSPLPNILANILLFNSETGQLKCIIEGTEITARRTAAASIVATKYLYFNREANISSKPILAIIGCGVQGRIHAIGFACTFDIDEIRLWNRTGIKAESLCYELNKMRCEFVNKILKISVVSESVELCVSKADIIVTATFSSEPVVHLNMLKSKNVHINAVGAGVNHHSEISQDIYDQANVFIDDWENAKIELKELKANIVGEVGELIIDTKKLQTEVGTTIFQSMGMASEDATVAQAVFDVIMNESYFY